MTDKPAKPAKASPDDEIVEFISSNKEPYGWEINFLDGRVNDDGYVVWRVPADKAPSFEGHFHCTSGRIRKA